MNGSFGKVFDEACFSAPSGFVPPAESNSVCLFDWF
jgi:hypothetical protein